MSMNQELNVIHGYEALHFVLSNSRETNVVTAIDGLPGIGKTSIMKMIAESWGSHILPPDLNPDDLPAGWTPETHFITVPNHEDAEFMVPNFTSWEGKSSYEVAISPILTRLTAGSLVVFDEWRMEGCNRSLLEMLGGDRLCLGDYTSPPVTRICIGNTADSGNFEHVDNAVLGNRQAQYVWTPDHLEWLEQYAMPNGIHPLIATTVKMEGQAAFLDYDSNRSRNTTPRSLTRCSEALLLAEARSNGTLTDTQRMIILAGFLNDGMALKVQSLFHLADKLVPYSAIVNTPDTCEVPQHPAALFMTCSNVSRRVVPDDWPSVMAWVQRLPLELRPAVVEPVFVRHPELQATPQGQAYIISIAPLKT